MDALGSSVHPKAVKDIEQRIWEELFSVANGQRTEMEAVQRLFDKNNSVLDLIKLESPSDEHFFCSGEHISLLLIYFIILFLRLEIPIK